MCACVCVCVCGVFEHGDTWSMHSMIVAITQINVNYMCVCMCGCTLVKKGVPKVMCNLACTAVSG